MSADKHFIVSNVIEAGVKVGRVVESVGGVGEELIAWLVGEVVKRGGVPKYMGLVPVAMVNL